jgi:regulator of replication initiation timing
MRSPGSKCRFLPSLLSACCAWLALAIGAWGLPCSLAQQPASAPVNCTPEFDRVERLETSLQSLIEENRRLAAEMDSLRQALLSDSVQNESSIADGDDTNRLPPKSESNDTGNYFVNYDNGFLLSSREQSDSLFSLKVNHQNTIRYSGFSRDESFWIDSTGSANSISNRSDFLIPRGRLILSGKALLPKLNYLLNIDYNTVGRNTIGFRAFALTYKFNRAFELSVGQNKVPGSREWLLSSWVAQAGPDRSMATTFFRPSLSQGMWLQGEPLERLYYHSMVSNGFNTLNQTPNQFNQRICLSNSVWWEPWGEFGAGYSDLEQHQDWVVRAGTSITTAFSQSNQADGDSIENSLVRLSDGTLLNRPGALVPGVTVQRYDLSLVALDLAFKHQGLSLSTEIYLQELSSLEGNGPLPFDSTLANGGFLQGGYFVLPQVLELYSRTSWVTGDFGSGSEIAGGLNWFILKGKSNLRFTFDVADLESCPADQNRTGFVAGQSGILIRTQINSSF